ncbi:hypothetical protein GEMRC1_012761 [Eukaryota sp. GEM-RC1]
MYYTIIYSSCSVHTAWLTRIILKKKPLKLQWLAVFVVTFGLSISALGKKNDPADEFDILLGCSLILIGSITHSTTYVLYEVFMKNKEKSLPSLVVCCFNGMYASAIVSCWVLVYVVPRWHELIVKPIIESGSDVVTVLWLYAGLTVVDLVHAAAFYILIGITSAITVGIFKGVQSTLVFVTSHFLFCSTISSQCFSYAKGTSLLVVVCGVFLYSFAKQKTVNPKVK